MRRIVFACALWLGGTLVPASTDAVRWRTGEETAPATLASTPLSTQLSDLSRREVGSHALIFAKPTITPDERQVLAGRGVQLLSYLGAGAYFASLDPALDALRVVESGLVVDARPILARWKLDPALAAGEFPEHSVVSRSPATVVALYVLFHRDFDVAHGAEALVARHGGTLVSRLRSIPAAFIKLPADKLEALAAEDDVAYLEPPLSHLQPTNNGARADVAADLVHATPYNLDGSGVTALIYDAGQVFAHADFAGRLTIGASDVDTVQEHATHVAGTVGGDGAASAGFYAGMAHEVAIVSYGENGTGIGYDPLDIENDYGEGISLYDADLANNSLGSGGCRPPYTIVDALLDEIVRGSLGKPFPSIWSSGNSGTSCGGFFSLSAPHSGKNTIAVGEKDSDSPIVAPTSSRGPTSDGRIKPEFVAPGCQATGDDGITSTRAGHNAYTSLCGTSMAAAVTTGVSALLIQQYRNSFPTRPDPRATTLKAILAATAEDLGNAGPDFTSGFGKIRADRAAGLIGQQDVVEAVVGPSTAYLATVEVGAPSAVIVALAWDDPPGTPNVDDQLVNDLDLRVIGPTGTVHFPWTLNPANPSALAVRNVRDGRNNIEVVQIDAAVVGTYLVEVRGRRIAEGPSQSFGLAATPALSACSSRGMLATGQASIRCSGSLAATVLDCDLDLNGGVANVAAVTVSSNSEPGGEVLVLTESGPATAQFNGTIPVASTDSPGVLRVAEGDTITVTYLDANDGAGGINVPVTRTLTVDCTAPTLTSVNFTQLLWNEAHATVTVGEPAHLIMRYGTSCATLDHVQSRVLGTTHVIDFVGLSAQTTYYYTLELTDAAGNGVVEGGPGCFSFTTPAVVDHLTEVFTSSEVFDLLGKSITWTPDGSAQFYSRCVEPLPDRLPVDPANGTVLTFFSSVVVPLPAGTAISFFGQTYTSMRVHAGGHLRFGSTVAANSLTGHFNVPGVAVLMTGISGARVSWQRLADRIVVTWEGVPNTSIPHTYQVEFFTDGRIRTSWLAGLGTTPASRIVGLSPGGGTPPGFVDSNLSTAPGCGGSEPFVANVTTSTAVGQDHDVAFNGVDDGLPLPSALTYRVLSPTALGILGDPDSGQPITAFPYELQADTGYVTYTPVAGHYGIDHFQYDADDGGASPTGGASAPATATIRIGAEEEVLAFLVDNTSPGWIEDSGWDFGQPTGNGDIFGDDPTSGATGTNVYGYNLNGAYEINLPPTRLTTLPLDLSLVVEARLEFQRWLTVERLDFAGIEIETAPSTWQLVWRSPPDPAPSIEDLAWTLQSFAIPSADQRSGVRLRWVMSSNADAGVAGGWNIDDIRIFGRVLESCTTPPGEPTRVVFAADKITLGWIVAPFTGGSTPAYDVLRSDSPAGFLSAVCLASGTPATLVTDPSIPAPDGARYYLVRAENVCGSGSLGQDSSGKERQGVNCP